MDKPNEQASGYRLLTFNEFSAGPPALEIIEDVLPAEGTACIYGRSGTGKTFLAIDLMLAIAIGKQDWFGHRVMQAPVVYLALEGAQGIRDRLTAYQSLSGSQIPDRFRILHDRFGLTSEEDRAALIEAVESCGLQRPVVVIDTLTRSTPGLDLNGPKDMGSVIDAVDAIQRKLGGLVISIYHSTIKGNGGSDVTEMGHSSLRGALDASIVVWSDEATETKYWSTKKVKDAATGKDHKFSLEPVEVRVNQWGNPKSSCAVLQIVDSPFATQPKNEDAERRALADQLENYIVSRYLDGHRYNATNLRDDPPPNMTTRQTKQAVSVLQTEGRLIEVELPKDEQHGRRKTYLHPKNRIDLDASNRTANGTEQADSTAQKEAA
jgi:hypothetical protein